MIYYTRISENVIHYQCFLRATFVECRGSPFPHLLMSHPSSHVREPEVGQWTAFPSKGSLFCAHHLHETDDAEVFVWKAEDPV